MSSRSQIVVPNSSQIERAWHLLTILIRLGRPASPFELASRSALDSIFLLPDLIEFLCFVPGSPISLTKSRLVTVSEVAVGVLGEFLNRSRREFVPSVFLFRVSELRDLRLVYSRKRKVSPLEAGLVGPRAKRRIFWDSERDVEQLGVQSSPAKALKVPVDVADTLANGLAAGVSSNVSNQEATLTPFIPSDNCLSSTFEIKNDDHLIKDSKSKRMCDTSHKTVLGKELADDSQLIAVQKEFCDKTQTTTVQNMFLELFGYDGSFAFEQNIVTSNSDNVGRVVTRDPDTGSALFDKQKDKTPLWMETLREGIDIRPAAPLAVICEVNPAQPILLGAEHDSNDPSVETDGLTSKVVRSDKHEIAAEVNNGETKSLTFLTDASRRKQDKSAVQTSSPLGFPAVSLSPGPGTNLKQQRTSSEKLKIINGSVSTVGVQKSIHESNTKMNNNSTNRDKDKWSEKIGVMKQKMRIRILNTSTKENIQEAIPKIPKINADSKLLPNFESFVVVEEEGSGGYGTVYKARRREDGKIFAVKYPHSNAHSHHIHNEMKMLERFGGRNFVIKYEGSFNNGQSECFVLEHVEHDRPEVLKKEIDIFELRWYGYCMFRALASLHKQDIVHRDVKPGNFLFSRKQNKGYLIDFNLASDLRQKFSKSSRSGNTLTSNLDPFSVSTTKSTSHNQVASVGNDHVSANIRKEVGNDSINIFLKNVEKRSNKGHMDAFTKIDGNNKYGSQAADSGVTSAKDPTSTRTHSADRLKQPISYKGRKELINFVQEAMQCPPHREVIGPVSQRKRVAAPLGKMNSRLMMLTPMPLHSGGNAVAGAGRSNKGDGKHKKGPCVGTKGFRAPEVLFKSCHQGCKVDIWSAGVTLLYLIIGKSPFGGDPELNIKEIAKLRGSEDLWEVAKLHNCESSFPLDLLDVRYVRSMKLKDWCIANTKRREFLEQIPQSLFDLVDKCLTVNPRCRIAAEEALMHSFFAPCHESIRRQRSLRRTAGSDAPSGNQSNIHDMPVNASIGLAAQ